LVSPVQTFTSSQKDFSLIREQKKAWALYCKENTHAVVKYNFWDEMADYLKKEYLLKVAKETNKGD
jgi:hypothetical protein